MPSKKQPKPTTMLFPATVVIDSREKCPFGFEGLSSDAKDGSLPLIVRTVRAGLPSGDYSLLNLESSVAVERKSISDLFGTVGRGRDRFERELERLNQMTFAAVVIEAGWVDIIHEPPPRSELSAKSIFRSVISWQQRFPRVHWWPCGSRRLAEVTTLRILERFWKDREREARIGQVVGWSGGGTGGAAGPEHEQAG